MKCNWDNLLEKHKLPKSETPNKSIHIKETQGHQKLTPHHKSKNITQPTVQFLLNFQRLSLFLIQTIPENQETWNQENGMTLDEGLEWLVQDRKLQTSLYVQI